MVICRPHSLRSLGQLPITCFMWLTTLLIFYFYQKNDWKYIFYHPKQKLNIQRSANFELPQIEIEIQFIASINHKETNIYAFEYVARHECLLRYAGPLNFITRQGCPCKSIGRKCTKNWRAISVKLRPKYVKALSLQKRCRHFLNLYFFKWQHRLCKHRALKNIDVLGQYNYVFVHMS